MKLSLRLLACSALLVLTAAAVQAASPWSVRLRATYLQTVDQSDAFTALGINFPKNAVAVNDKMIPEIDVDYAFTDSFGAEVVLTIPQTQDVTLAGVGKLGTFKHLPPTFLLQYRANSGGSFRPYIGAGVNFTLIWDSNSWSLVCRCTSTTTASAWPRRAAWTGRSTTRGPSTSTSSAP